MGSHRIAPRVVAVAAALALLSCRADSISEPDVPLVVASDRDDDALVVDDDGADCPEAGFTSIQAAVNAAEDGSTIRVCPGTYHENVQIEKNDLRLLAEGDRGEVVLDGGGPPFADALFAGFELRDAHGNLIEGFLVRHYREAGIWVGPSSTGNTIRENVTTGHGHDGIQLVDAHENLVKENVSIDNLAPVACGVNIVAGSSRNVVRENRFENNEWGIQLAGSATTGNVISENEVVGNRGNGIRNIVGASETLIEENDVFGNGFMPSQFTGTTNSGIRIQSGAGILVRENTAFGNELFDLLQDGGQARFEENECGTSSPPGLCEDDG